MAEYAIPSVYIEELHHYPVSITSVETAIPAFIGYTEKAKRKKKNDLRNIPTLIQSIAEYELFFGKARSGHLGILVTIDSNLSVNATIDPVKTSRYLMYYSLQLYFLNGGGSCYIISVDGYSKSEEPAYPALKQGLDSIEKMDKITLIVFPDSINMLSGADYYQLHKDALLQCSLLKDRFTVMDLWINPDKSDDDIYYFREQGDLGSTDIRKYGAIYYPRIYCDLKQDYDEKKLKVMHTGHRKPIKEKLSVLKAKNAVLYEQAKNEIDKLEMLVPVSSAVTGKYVESDNAKGVWKAPTNINIEHAIKPEKIITDTEQASLNIDELNGKSINIIRTFPGRGSAIIWGGRTLAGNDPEWKYVSVRRFCNMVEESVKKGTEHFIFEPNEQKTWTQLRSETETYLINLWRAGALIGDKPSEAFFVRVGAGQTMTQADIDEGRLIVEIGLAIIKPAEFIILRFTHSMCTKANGSHSISLLDINTLAELASQHPEIIQQVKKLENKLKSERVRRGSEKSKNNQIIFYGSEDGGQKLAASLLAKSEGKEIFRVDLSTIISKYIGETEKNLSAVFKKAEHKDWILFFDEADALFGKRTNVSDAHDRYANQESAYLLQKIEEYNGLVILAARKKKKIAEAFKGRLNTVIHFPLKK